MNRKLAALTPFGLAALVLMSASTLTFAAVTQGKPAAHPRPAAKVRKTAVVPDVQGQAYVFAKGILEDAGFAWKVTGAVKGYPANAVASQTPAAGTIVVDTGAPTVKLTLAKNARYAEDGTPDNSAPYAGTRLLLPGQSTNPLSGLKGGKLAPAAKTGQAKPVAKAKAKPAAKAKARPAKRQPAKTQPAKRQPVAADLHAGKLQPNNRPPAFVAPGAPKEPLNEMPLPDRAHMLASWVNAHPKRSPALLKHWLYQHAWIVYGAKFGWWHGAEALEILIGVDKHVEKLWGIGGQSQSQARAALEFVRQHAR